MARFLDAAQPIGAPYEVFVFIRTIFETFLISSKGGLTPVRDISLRSTTD